MEKRTKIISAFPCCGKSYICNNVEETLGDPDLVVLDSDSSRFSWIEENGEKKRNPDFPKNYIKYIKENIGKADYIFVSSHKVVREALAEAGIQFTIVVPDRRYFVEWMMRSLNRGDSSDFTDNMIKNWDFWLKDIENEKKTYNKKLILSHYQFLSDVISEV